MADDPALEPQQDSAGPDSASAEPATSAPCRNLRNKGMYVYHGEYGSSHEDYDNTIYWCVKTQKGFGPDDEMCSRDDCISPERVCYEPL
jgi:hypothetical protein